MNDSGSDQIPRKNPNEKYYFFVEKSSFEKVENINNKKNCPPLSGIGLSNLAVRFMCLHNYYIKQHTLAPKSIIGGGQSGTNLLKPLFFN